MEKEFEIRPAEIKDADIIADVIMEALGKELCESFTSEGNTLQDVHDLFAICGASADSQYSYKNTLIATVGGQSAGAIICYDGARLNELRQRFLDEFAKMHGYRIDQYITEETTPDEFYIDSLAVLPEYRGKGIARGLIEAACRWNEETCGKKVGLLVDKTNHRARGMYERLGFKPDGEREFAGEAMEHMTISN